MTTHIPPPPPTTDLWTLAQGRVADYLTPAVRLGVTGLSRSGKTVFITALVRNLVAGGRLPFFTPDAEGRIVRAYLEPQPDDSVPRFEYESHFDCLQADPPTWPESTRRISQLRVTIEYRPQSSLKRALGLSKLHLDIVDYPGEWLIDLPLLNQSFTEFSNEALTLARAPQRIAAAKPWLDFLAGTDPAGADDEQVALHGTKLFTDYLLQSRKSDSQATLAPGRFLMPGDLEGSPLLTFFPMPLSSDAPPPRGSLASMMMRRYESYKSLVVRPFFNDHFRRLDRQIVLVDVLSALNDGPAALSDLDRALDGVLKAFRPGANSWFSALLSKRIDKVLFCATKADLLPASSHDRLGAILKRVVDGALERAESLGAGVSALALAAVRTTRETEIKSGKDKLPCLKGVPLAGERVGDTVFDGKTAGAIFPGDLPADAEAALDLARQSKPGSLHLVRFRPPAMPARKPGEPPPSLPHIRLDRALDFLISDYLA